MSRTAKREIIETNLPLGVSITPKHTDVAPRAWPAPRRRKRIR